MDDVRWLIVPTDYIFTKLHFHFVWEFRDGDIAEQLIDIVGYIH